MQEKKSESSFAQIKTKIKVVFLGEQSTGKTSILTRYIQDKFEEGSGVHENILRLRWASTSWLRTSMWGITSLGCSCGILQARKGFDR